MENREREYSSARFEERITNAFETLGYKVKKRIEPAEFDFIVQKYEFPLEIEAIVEIKYFEHSLVPGSVVYQVLNLLEKTSFDKAIIVTTLGFNENAKRIAEENFGRIVLLTEIELMEQLPRREFNKLFSSFLNSNYVASSVHEYFIEREPKYDEIISRIPRERLCEYLYEFISSEELKNLVTEKIPKSFLFEEFQKRIALPEVKDILSTLTKKVEIPKSRKQNIKDLYEQAKSTNNSQLKGKLFEQAISEIFKLVPKINFAASNIDDGIEEIDIQLRNHNHEHVWADFEGMIFVECKNWSNPVGSDEISSFKTKLERNGLKIGLFVALKGVTGSPAKLGGAWGAIKMFLPLGYKIVVIDDTDLEAIFRCEDASEIVDKKFVLLYKLGSGKAKI